MAHVSSTRTVPVPNAFSVDAARVQVRLRTTSGTTLELGRADVARRDKRLTAAERAAIDALVEAMRLLRVHGGLVGIDDAGTGVRLLLRDPEATSGGPYATAGQIAIGSRNALAARTAGRGRADVLLPVDTAAHELTHVAQFARVPVGTTPNAGILEGIADAVAMLATGDDTLGEEYFNVDAAGRHRGSIRELGAHDASGPAIGAVAHTYARATRSGVEAHEAGGLVSTVVAKLRDRLGSAHTERLLWAVIRDEAAWLQGGSWAALAAAFQRAADASGDAADPIAVRDVLNVTGLDAALR
jgi:hypothetical protein